MATTAMSKQLQSCALGAASAPSMRCNETVGLPGLCVSAKSSPRRQSCELRSQLLPSFNASIPSLRGRRSKRARAGRGGALTVTSFAADPEQLKGAREEIKKLLAETKCHPILIRLGWHDAGTYDKNISEWPQCGGANGSARFEMNHAANAGLPAGLKLLFPVKEKFPGVSYADLYQLASATAIEDAGGPKIEMKYGRLDIASEAESAIEGNLPSADPPQPADHLRKVFYRMGLSDKEIVALSGAHTVGRSRPDRSGFGKAETKYTNPTDKFIGNPGGQSWTVDWLTFDNSYFKDIKAQSDEDLLVLPTDKILTEDPEFKKYTDIYAEDEKAFFKDYAEAHKRLSELGTKFDPPEGISIDAEVPAPEEAVVPAPKAPEVSAPKAAALYVDDDSADTEQRELSDTMKAKIRAEYLAIGGSPEKPLGSNYFLNIIIVIAVLAVLSSLVTQN